MHEALIVSGSRTPIGAFGGGLARVPAPELAARCVESVLQRSQVGVDLVDEVILGNVIGAGIGQNPARQATLKAGLPVSVGATTVNKVCGSGLKAVMLAAQSIQLGHARIVVAGGMENMSLAPYLLPQARTGYRLGNGSLVDSLMFDGLWDCYGEQPMGTYGDRCAEAFGFSREQQDDFAVRSYTRALTAISRQVFDAEITPIDVVHRKRTTTVSADEEPLRFDEDKLRALRPAFAKDGTVTAGNASSINDGAAALLLVAEGRAPDLSVPPIARIVGAATFSREPEWFTTAPIGAIRKLLDAVQWSVETTDLFEINEAFATVTMAAEKELELPAEKVNIFGGAVSLGHPIGCSGARILVTLLNGLKQTGGRRGIACLCIGGGEAVALAVEMV